MSEQYSLEFAVKSSTELRAMNHLKSLSIAKADEAKLSDLDRQAGLFIIKVSVTESELPDNAYQNLLADKDIFILSDELSAKRAQKIINLTATIEQQLKKLLICVLPETEQVLGDIIRKHQKHKSDFQPTSRIEWCRKINDFSFGELPKVLEEDVSDLAKKQLLSSEGLLSLIASAKNFGKLQSKIAELSKPKTIWDSINAIIENPVDYSYISDALNDLCEVRNDAAHLKTITAKRLAEAEKSQKHVILYINNIKSSYRESLQANMKSLSEAMKPILESAIKIDPSVFIDYQKMISETFKPLTDTISELKLDIVSPVFSETIRQNSAIQSQMVASSRAVLNNMKLTDSYKETMEHLVHTSFSDYVADSLKEFRRSQFNMGKIIETSENILINDKDDESIDDLVSGDSKDSKK